MNLSFNDLISYTEWERQSWHEFLKQKGPQVLQMSAGPNGDGRFQTIGDLIRHIFSAEKRYVERLTDSLLTDTASIPTDDIERLFEFGRESRNDMKMLLEKFRAAEWDVQREFKIFSFLVNATPRKIVTHTLMHEIRHWAQIATMLRFSGVPGAFHDFIGSPVMGGNFSQTK